MVNVTGDRFSIALFPLTAGLVVEAQINIECDEMDRSLILQVSAVKIVIEVLNGDWYVQDHVH